jgi:hypothetical protein
VRLLLLTFGASIAFLVVTQITLGWSFSPEQVSIITLTILITLAAFSRRVRLPAVMMLLACNSEAQIDILCAAERPVVYSGESVAVRAWVTDSNGERIPGSPKFTWHVDHGEISGAGTATWTLNNIVIPARNGVRTSVPATATVEVDFGGHGSGKCEASILVAERPSTSSAETPRERSQRLTARLFLLRNMIEPSEYGLRSYLLFSDPPKDKLEKERYLKAIEVYLRVLAPAEDFLAQNVRASQLNITLLPATKAVELPPQLDDPAAVRSVAAEILQAYDYARAKLVLAEFDLGAAGRGPYLVSRESRSGPTRAGLLVDMTGVSPSLVWDWMNSFCWLAGQERSWSEVTIKKLGLNLRNVIAVTATTTPVVLASLTQWVFILKPR